MNVELPENTLTEDGQVRRVGIEIEFAGMEPEQGAELIRKHVGGNIHTVSPFSIEIRDTEYGLFVFEIDAAFLKEEKYKKYSDKLGIDFDNLDSKDELERVLRDLAITVVPCEIVMPPVPMDQLSIAHKIIASLHDNKAKGTRDSMMYAFGLHINVEVAEMTSGYLLQHIQAYSLLYDWICEKSDVNITRRITPYINRYPDEYLETIFQNNYQPEIDKLINDYLKLVGSRNHALDMLPVFAEIEEEKVLSLADEPDLIKPRPAFHYRLANSNVDEPGWNIFSEWHYWLQIEKLAHDEILLEELITAFRNQKTGMFSQNKKDWIKEINRHFS